MRKLITILFFLTSLASYSQQAGPVTSVATKTQLKTLNFGQSATIFVSDSNAFYKLCSPCTADDVFVIAGTSGRKWKKVEDQRIIGLLGALGITPFDSTSLSNRINGKLNIADTASILAPYARTNQLEAGLATKQNTLVSGTNIKTINGTSLLGSGNLTISGEGGGSANPGGSFQQIQFNGDGAFSADPSFAIDTTSKQISLSHLYLNRGLGTENSAVINIPTIQGTAQTGSQPFGSFSHTLAQSYFNGDGQRDAVYQWGYNHTGTGGRVNPYEAEFHVALESHYQRFLNASPEFEYHWESTTKSGLTQRHYSMQIDKQTGAAISFWQMDGMQWFASGEPVATTPAYMLVNKQGIFTLQGPATQFNLTAGTAGIQMTPINDGSGQTHLNNLGNGTAPGMVWNSIMLVNTPSPFVGNGAHFAINSNQTTSTGKIFLVSDKQVPLFWVDSDGFTYLNNGMQNNGDLYLPTLSGTGNRSIGVNSSGKIILLESAGGSSYTFGSGLTNTASTITNDLLTGKAGGQTILGGTSSSDILLITSTSNATKSRIQFGTSSAYDEANGRLGIGKTNPSVPLDVVGATVLGGNVTINNGGKIELIGGNAAGDGNIKLNTDPGGAGDVNVIHLGSTSQTGGFMFGATPAFSPSNGPFFAARGNTYTASGNQRGSMYIAAGTVSTPAAGEGSIIFYTGATEQRFSISATGVSTFTGDVIGVTKTAGDNTTSFATTAFVTGAVSTALSSNTESAQDAVGGILGASFTYNDAGNTITLNDLAITKITNLQSSLDAKADLVGGIVPVNQLPDAIVGISTVANFAALPGTGTANTIYITTNDNKRYIWTGSVYVELAPSIPVTSVNTETGAVVLDYADVGAVPTGRTLTVNGTPYTLSADRTINVGTVTTASVATANGFTGSVATASSTPEITVSLNSLTGMLKGSGSTISVATSGTDYSLGTAALGTGILKSTTLTGALSIAVAADFPTLNQNTSGTAAGLSATLATNRFPAMTGDVTNTVNTVATTIATNVVSNAKLAQMPANTIKGNATGSTANASDLTVIPTAVMPAFTGDVTSSAGSLGLTIAANAVTVAKMQTAASQTILGRNTSGTGNMEVLTVLPTGVIPAFTGDVTNVAGTLGFSITNDAVTYAKMQNISANNRLLGRYTTGAGDPQEITIGSGLSLNTSTGELTASAGGTVDATIIDGSTNAVQGNAVFDALALKQNTLTIDATATNGSTNPIQSNAVFDGLALKQNLVTLTTTGTSGAATFNQSTGALNIPQYAGGSFTGGTLTSQLILAAGTATAATAPLEFQSGTLNTTAEAGALEYDGKVFYATPQGTKRGISTVSYVSTVQADFTLTASATAQNVFPAAQDVITLDATTTYEFEGLYILNTGATTHTTAMSFVLGGGLTVNSFEYTTQTWNAALNTIASGTAVSFLHVSGVGSKVLNATSGAVYTMVKFKGYARVNVGGTLTPQITFSANPTGTNLLKTGSYIKFTPIGSNTVTINPGAPYN